MHLQPSSSGGSPELPDTITKQNLFDIERSYVNPDDCDTDVYQVNAGIKHLASNFLENSPEIYILQFEDFESVESVGDHILGPLEIISPDILYYMSDAERYDYASYRLRRSTFQVDLGYLDSIDSGNRFPSLNKFERNAEMCFDLGDDQEMILYLTYPADEDGLPSKPSISIGSISDRSYPIYLTTLDGEEYPVKELFNPIHENTPIIQLANQQFETFRQETEPWGILLPEEDTPSDKYTCGELIRGLASGKWSLEEPFLVVFQLDDYQSE